MKQSNDYNQSGRSEPRPENPEEVTIGGKITPPEHLPKGKINPFKEVKQEVNRRKQSPEKKK